MKTKQELRTQYLQLRNDIPYKDVLDKSRQIIANLVLYQPLINAKTVMSYMPKGNEADLVALDIQLWESGRKILIPVCTNQYGAMEAAVLCQEELFKLDRDIFGIWVPKSPQFVAPETIDMVLVPGVAFDRQGRRLGHGRGYYDRYLNRIRANAVTVGIGFDAQIAETLPEEQFDIRLDALCTESGIIEITDK